MQIRLLTRLLCLLPGTAALIAVAAEPGADNLPEPEWRILGGAPK